MRWTFAVAGATLLAGLLALPAIAADPPKKPAPADAKKPAPDAPKKKEKGPWLRWAHSHKAAVEEAKERNCVLFVTIHAEH